ncbi:hypothetical protein OG320_04240 [Microbispora sp. NBC_01189]|nr:hypothetical protein OG320_04240 [Microbispora sp. NBC_01189]
MTFAEDLPVYAYRCCTCNGTGIDADNARCRDCDGTGIDNRT